MRIAIIGAGVSGLVAAHLLHPQHEITVFEQNGYLGGHAHTVRVPLDDCDLDVDTGFIVYNDCNYPLFSRLLGDLEVATEKSAMSFSVSHRPSGFEYRATNADTIFAERHNLLRPSFHRMLVDIARFNRAGRRLLERGDDSRTLGELLAGHGFSRRLRDHFVVPLGSSIWSADPATFDEIPASTYARFMANHGLLGFRDQPQWRTISGGAARYVAALSRPFRDRVQRSVRVDKVVRRDRTVEVHSDGGEAWVFDRVVVAAHSDQALALLSDPSPAERAVLGAIRYQENVATLHTDTTMLPRSRRAWASWNHHLLDERTGRATLTYHMNQLQAIDSRHEILVTLNREDDIDPATVLGSYSYAHPVFDAAAVRAQGRRSEIQGHRGTYYCGAYWGYGFHEDGVRSAYDVARLLGVPV